MGVASMDNYEFNRFEDELNKLDIDQTKEVDYGLGPEKVRVEGFAGASADQINSAEASLDLELPSDFKSFLERWNGALLYQGKYRPGYRVFGTVDLVKRNLIWREHELPPEDQIADILLFADAGDGDYFAFGLPSPTSSKFRLVLDGDHNFPPADWDVIANSFEEWLDHFIQAEGRMQWVKDEGEA
jgi:hypothetical protein